MPHKSQLVPTEQGCQTNLPETKSCIPSQLVPTEQGCQTNTKKLWRGQCLS